MDNLTDDSGFITLEMIEERDREIERLRAALEQIKYECAKCKYIAREALRDEEE